MNYYEQIKNQLLKYNTIKEKYSDLTNKEELDTFYIIGQLLNELIKNNKDKDILKDISIKLKKEVGKGYSITNLKYILKFYLKFKDYNSISYDLKWSHYIELLSLEKEEINYYINIIKKENITYRELHKKIIKNEHLIKKDNIK